MATRLLPTTAAGGGDGPLRPTLLDRAWALRDRLLASPRFQAWATAFPPTRPIARRRARALFDVCAGFVYAQVLHACVSLDVFAILAEGPRTAAALAPRLGLSREATVRLLGAAASLGLAERRGRDRFGLGPLGAAMLGNPGIAAMVLHHPMLYADLADPVALLRGEKRRGDTELGRYWAYASAEDPRAVAAGGVGAYTELMAASQAMIAAEALDAYPGLARHRRLLDLGGGDGSFLRAAAARAPDLHLALLDLPPVAEIARARLAEAGLAHRAETLGGSFLDPAAALPADVDLVSLVRVVHDHDDGAALAILRTARRALAPRGGTLLLAEPMAGTPGAEPYFALYLLAMGSGRPRTPDELQGLLREAGFASSRLVPTRRPLLCRLIVAHAAADGR